MFKALDATSNFIRALVSLVLLGVAGLGGWLGYEKFYADDTTLRQQQEELAAQKATIDALNTDLAEKRKEIERLDTAVRLLKVDHRVAQINVLEQNTLPDGKLQTRFTFGEVDEQGHPLEPLREFRVEGDIVHIDAWVVSFLDEYVEKGDPLRGTALCLFRRIYGEYQTPDDGFPLDPIGSRPAAYSRGSEMSEVEREIWENFWQYANDAQKARQDGVRTAHGKVSYTKLLPGKKYKLLFRSTGDLTIQPEAGGAAVSTKAL